MTKQSLLRSLRLLRYARNDNIVFMKQPCIYIMTNKVKTVLYTGVTSDLAKRVWEHKNNITGGFTTRYRCHKLVYYEQAETMEAAITREKQLKAGSRQKKINLIETMNSEWLDLYDRIV